MSENDPFAETTEPAPPETITPPEVDPRVAELEAKLSEALTEVARLNHPGTYGTGLVVRANEPEQGGGFSAYFEKPATGDHPATLEFSACGMGDSAPAAVQSLCELFAECLRARDERLADFDERTPAPRSSVPREPGVPDSRLFGIDPSSSPAEFDRQVEVARAAHAAAHR
jgi:hypothetical protein